MKVLVHTRSAGKYDWKMDAVDFARVPSENECLELGPDSLWQQVQLVVHRPLSEECVAEIYTVEVDSNDVKHRAFHGSPE